MYTCQTCSKALKSKKTLNAHIKKYHAEKQKTASQDTPENEEAEVLEVDPQDTENGVQVYECADCGNSVTRNDAACSKCGAVLDWSGV